MKWVYIFISDLTRNEYDYYFSLMDVNKQKQVSRYKNEIDKKRTVAGEMLARRMISKYCKVVPEDIYFETGCYGKPNAKHLNVEFNISHSQEMVVCAISDKPVGIDVEMIRPISTNILRKLCTDIDLKYILGSDRVSINIPNNFDDQQLHRFYEVWTAKEAYFKCIGTGIKNLKSISMDELVGNRKMYQIENYIITIVQTDNYVKVELKSSTFLFCNMY